MRCNIRLAYLCVRHKSSTVSENIAPRTLAGKAIDDEKSANSRFTSSNTSNAGDICSVEHIGFENNNEAKCMKAKKQTSTVSVTYNAADLPKNFEKAFGTDTNAACTTESESQKKEPRVDEETRHNEINVQMLSKSLYQQIFKDSQCGAHVPSQVQKAIKDNLSLYGIKTESATRLPEVKLELPPLQGNNIEEHFYNIAQEQIKPYLKLINDLLTDIPQIPEKWSMQEGWTRYTTNGAEAVDYPLEPAIIFDVEVCMKSGVLPTIATAVTPKAWYGWVSKSLVDNTSAPFEGQQCNPNMMIPLESTKTESGKKLKAFHKKPKIVVGHNVSFDRSKVKEQYWLDATGTRFLDTMSMHIAVSGISSYQRTLLAKSKGDEDTESIKESEESADTDGDWTKFASLNSLKEVSKLYCGLKLQKEARDVFVQGTLADVKSDFCNLMTYCANDVVATHKVLCKLFPLFQERFPHPVTLAGTLELGSVYLPVNSNWQRYIEEAESAYEDLHYELKFALAKRADAVCKLMHNDKYKEDLWMWDEDWSTRQMKISKQYLKAVKAQERARTLVKADTVENSLANNRNTDIEEEEEEPDPLKEEFDYLHNTKDFLPKRLPHMPGYPNWYRKLCLKLSDPNWEPGAHHISTSMKVTAKLLNLTWNNYPLHHVKNHGWGILVPFNKNPEQETKVPLKQLFEHCSKINGTPPGVQDYNEEMLEKEVQDDLPKTEFWRHKKKKNEESNPLCQGSVVDSNLIIDDCCYFFKLPHPNGPKYNVGNPLSKEFLNKFAENVLAGVSESAAQVLQIAKMLTYWRNNRDRIMSQLVVWHNEDSLPSSLRGKKKYTRYGAILPGVIASGTLTRRAVERTWLTASNAKRDRIGSELRSMVQAPPGYHIIGADVDSQELWIASLLGDAQSNRIHGCTPFGWMTLIGTKSEGTDMHSVTAKAVGISRDHAKVINYARIYGAGQKFAETLLKQFNPSMSEAEAASKSRKMFAMTKGKKTFNLKPEYEDRSIEEGMYSSYEAYRFAKAHNKKVEELFEHPVWVGGSESAMFNKLEAIACTEKPVTPFLDSRLTRALELGKDHSKYLPTRVNWVVQSGAVDFLHLMLVSMRWLLKGNARFCLSFHDEVRYLVPSQYKYNAALAMHVTNLLTRSFCASRVGIKDLPLSVAFFSSVEVDTALRKDATDDCITPSNPHGLNKGYGIPPGECLDIYATLEKSNGSLGPWHEPGQQ